MRTRLTGAVLLAVLLAAGCGSQGKLERLRRQSLAAQMVIADEKDGQKDRASQPRTHGARGIFGVARDRRRRGGW